jgi:EF-P beta-lysylation protein EpmB
MKKMKCNSDKTKRWQTSLIEAVTDPVELIELLQLDPALLESAQAAARLFPLKVPRSFIARMKKGDANDPLLRQVLPLGAELLSTPGYVKDPLQEKAVNPVSGLLHKYASRVLLTLTSACGVNCRYCFRRHFDYENNTPGTAGWEEALQYIANDTTINEVILSGGDPLVVPDLRLAQLTQKLATIPHVKRLRLHSRMPIVMPERVTEELVQSITHPALKTILVLHCNHPQEINHEVIEAMQLLKGIVLLNQAVLLKGINDEVETLISLSENLFEAGIQPYYLHVLDKVDGTAHFDLELETATRLHSELANRLSGYLIPKLACEQPGAPAKTLLNSSSFYTGQI